MITQKVVSNWISNHIYAEKSVEVVAEFFNQFRDVRISDEAVPSSVKYQSSKEIHYHTLGINNVTCHIRRVFHQMRNHRKVC